jgi:hypothetical protein
MNRIFLLSALFTFFFGNAFSQIVITSADMPVPGDTVRKSTTFVLDGIDYLPNGPNRTWFFEDLTVMSQQVDTFLSVSETPGIYQIFFNNQFIYPHHTATVALKLGTFAAIPGLALTDSYLFIKNTDEEIREVGYGVTLEGVSIPIQFQQIDTIYRFPLEYGDVDSAQSLFSVNVPDVGFLLMSKNRRNTVDAWGTLTTPYGEFQTLRVKTEIYEYDSLYSDSLGIGFPIIRNYTEYKWLANGYPEPVLQITDELGIGANAVYIDSIRSTFLEIPETIRPEFAFSVFPNPTRDYVTVSYELMEDEYVNISLYSIYGNKIRQFPPKRQEKGLYNQVIYLKETGLKSGVYLIELTIGDIPYCRRIIIN